MKLNLPSPRLNLPTGVPVKQQMTSTTMTPGKEESANPLVSTFGDLLKAANQTQLDAEAKQTEFLTSPKKDIHGTMVAMEKADLSLRLLLQVRNKVVSAYDEIMRMQV